MLTDVFARFFTSTVTPRFLMRLGTAKDCRALGTTAATVVARGVTDRVARHDRHGVLTAGGQTSERARCPCRLTGPALGGHQIGGHGPPTVVQRRGPRHGPPLWWQLCPWVAWAVGACAARKYTLESLASRGARLPGCEADHIDRELLSRAGAIPCRPSRTRCAPNRTPSGPRRRSVQFAGRDGLH